MWLTCRREPVVGIPRRTFVAGVRFFVCFSLLSAFAADAVYSPLSPPEALGLETIAFLPDGRLLATAQEGLLVYDPNSAK